MSELLERLGLDDVTLVGNGPGGTPVQRLAAEGPARVGRIELVSCDAFDNFPPGLTGRTLMATGKLPPMLFGPVLQPLRLWPLRRLPLAFGWLTKREDAVAAHWLTPVLTRREIRRDTVRAIAADRRLLLEAAERLASFDRPALIAWAAEDRVMPLAHGLRLADILPHGRLAEIRDSYTLIPLDQPAALADAIELVVRRSRVSVA